MGCLTVFFIFNVQHLIPMGSHKEQRLSVCKLHSEDIIKYKQLTLKKSIANEFMRTLI